MQVYESIEQISLPEGCVLTIGNFDGLHLGHRALINLVLEHSRRLKLASAVLSFHPHPMTVLYPDKPFSFLYPKQDLSVELTKMSVDHLIIEPFTQKLSLMTPQAFIQNLKRRLNFQELCIGHDFSFGKDRSGSETALREMGTQLKFEIRKLSPFVVNNEVVSSSRIRQKIMTGDVSGAATLLNRNYIIQGKVIKGEGRGQRLGIRTANLDVQEGITPLQGVYLTRLHFRGKTFPSITNIGTKPTFHKSYHLSVECHIIGENIELYDQVVELELIQRIRDELKFPTVDALMKQVTQDIQKAKIFFGV